MEKDKNKNMVRTGEMFIVCGFGWWVWDRGFKLLGVYIGRFFLWAEPFFIWLLKLLMWASLAGVVYLIVVNLYSLHVHAVEREKDVARKLAIEATNAASRADSWSRAHGEVLSRNKALRAELEALKKQLEELASKPEAKAQEAVSNVAAALIGGGTKVV